MPASSRPRTCAGQRQRMDWEKQFATWAGTVLNREHPIVLIAAPPATYTVSHAPRPHRLQITSVGYLPRTAFRLSRIAAGILTVDTEPRRRGRGVQYACSTPAAAGRRRWTSRPSASAATRDRPGSIGVPLQSTRVRPVRAPLRSTNHRLLSGGYRSSIAASRPAARGPARRSTESPAVSPRGRPRLPTRVRSPA